MLPLSRVIRYGEGNGKVTITINRGGRLFYAIPAAAGLWQIGELTPGQPGESSVGHYILGMGQASAGELYIATSGERAPTGQTGQVYKLIPR
jgi:hypothetical protein